MTCKLVLFLLAGLLAMPLPLFAQASLALPEYQLGPGDHVSIRVQGVREFSQTARISNSGRIRVPYVGIVFAAGKSTHELEAEIAAGIREHELVNEPLVRVEVEEQRARPTYVVGEVVTPGQFVISGEMHLLDIISRAGGLQPTAGSIAYVYRRPAPRPDVTARIAVSAPADEPPPAQPAPPPLVPAAEEKALEINLDDLQDGVRPELNIRLQGGDVVYVPRRPMRNVYIIGDVKVPGVYGLPRRGEVTAAQAIVYAGGPLGTAKVKRGFLMRYDETGQHQAIPVNFSAILEGKEPDVAVRPDDIIFIPNSTARTIGLGLLNMIPNIMIQILIF